jgi:hypothetical protein
VADLCEWDPARSCAAELNNEHQEPAALIVGANGEWRLCAQCAALPRFRRFRVRRVIRRG